MASFLPAADSIPHQPIHNPRPIRAIIVGGGPSGLLMAYKICRNFVAVDWVIYEKNSDVGGTWHENQYPGCRCDNPAHTYVWTFDQNPEFSATYSTAAECKAYFKSFQRRFELERNTKTSHEVVRATWAALEGRWEVLILNKLSGKEISDQCHVLINAGGFLNAPRHPDASELSKFRGQVVHTAAWPPSLDLSAKRVAVIGNGSSGIQVAPAILPTVSKLIIFVRNAAWIAAIGSSYRSYSQAEVRRFHDRPEDLTLLRKWLEHTANQAFPTFILHSDAQHRSRQTLTSFMQETLQEHPQADGLIPHGPVGCRRLSPGHGYLESIKDPKTRVVIGEISNFTPTGIVSDGEEVAVDVIVCATGFDTSFKPRFPIIAGDKCLTTEWEAEPRSYFGIAVPGFPNYFTILGPNSPLANGPVLVGIEVQADYICKILNRIQSENVKAFTVKEDAVHDFITYKDRFMSSTVWGQQCSSWYKGHAIGGKVVALWPGSTLHYIESLREVRYEDFDVCYFGNRFEYFGNGFSRFEMQSDADLAPYIYAKDDSAILGSKFDYRRKPAGF